MGNVFSFSGLRCSFRVQILLATHLKFSASSEFLYKKGYCRYGRCFTNFSSVRNKNKNQHCQANYMKFAKSASGSGSSSPQPIPAWPHPLPSWVHSQAHSLAWPSPREVPSAPRVLLLVASWGGLLPSGDTPCSQPRDTVVPTVLLGKFKGIHNQS